MLHDIVNRCEGETEECREWSNLTYLLAWWFSTFPKVFSTLDSLNLFVLPPGASIEWNAGYRCVEALPERADVSHGGMGKLVAGASHLTILTILICFCVGKRCWSMLRYVVVKYLCIYIIYVYIDPLVAVTKFRNIKLHLNIFQAFLFDLKDQTKSVAAYLKSTRSQPAT